MDRNSTTRQAAQAPDASKKPGRRGSGGKVFQTLLIPVLSIFTGLVFGAIVIVATDASVIAAYRNFFQAPGAALLDTWNVIALAYGSLFNGAFGSPTVIVQGIQAYLATGDQKALLMAIYPFTESLAAVTPYILAGLAVAVGFKCGLFNIGAEGQFGIGALCSAFVGYSIKGLPWFVHLPLALLAGAIGGAIWAAIPGYLKAVTGAHEVVNTIMMNYISYSLGDWLVERPDESARLPAPDARDPGLGHAAALLPAAPALQLGFCAGPG